MVYIGIVLVLIILYINGYQASRMFLETVHPVYQNYFANHYPRRMALFFPVTILFFHLIPRGYFGYFLACYIMLLGSLVTWAEMLVAFIFLPVSWFWFAVFCAATFFLGLFVPREMDYCIKSAKGAQFPQYYIPRNGGRL